MVLKVALPEGAYLADVGFGGLLASTPLRLLYDVEQPTPTGVLRLVESDGLVTLQAKLASHWQDVYRFTLEPQFPIDFEVANWLDLDPSEFPLSQCLDGPAADAARAREPPQQAS